MQRERESNVKSVLRMYRSEKDPPNTVDKGHHSFAPYYEKKGHL